MKNLILFLTINIFSICTAQIKCEKQIIDQVDQKVEKRKSLKELCKKDIQVIKRKLNSGCKWVKDNPKTSLSIASNIALVGIIIYVAIKHNNIVNEHTANDDKLIDDYNQLADDYNNLLDDYDALRKESSYKWWMTLEPQVFRDTVYQEGYLNWNQES